MNNHQKSNPLSVLMSAQKKIQRKKDTEFFSLSSQQLTKSKKNQIHYKKSKIKQNKLKQLIFDVGQHNLGSTTCKECGMLYYKSNLDDEKLHQKFHRTGITYTCSKSDCIIENCMNKNIHNNLSRYDNNTRIIRVGHCKKLKDLQRIVNLDLGSCSSYNPEDETVYIHLSGKKIQGCLFIKHYIKNSFPVSQIKIQTQKSEKEKERSVPYGISKIWTHPSYRRNGIATCLLNSALVHLSSDCYPLKRTDIAFSQPTEAGKRFASSYSGKDYLVYDQA